MKPNNTYAKRPRHHSQSRGRPQQQFSSFNESGGETYDPRMKGTAQQQLTKYLSLARDAAASGDRVASEEYYQYADHYQRVLNTFRPVVRPPQPSEPGEPMPQTQAQMQVQPPQPEPKAEPMHENAPKEEAPA